MNRDDTQLVSNKLKLPFNITQKLSINQVSQLSKLIYEIPSIFKNINSQKLLDAFNSEKVHGGIGYEINVQLFESLLKQNDIDLNQLTSINKMTLIGALTRNTGGKLIDFRLFRYLLQYWSSILTNPSNDEIVNENINKSNQIDDINKIAVSIKVIHSDWLYVFNMIKTRIKEVIDFIVLENDMNISVFHNLLRMLDIKLSASDLEKFTDVLESYDIINRETNTVHMKLLISILNSLDHSDVNLTTNEADKEKVYTSIINKIKNNKENLIKYLIDMITSQKLNSFNIIDFRKALNYSNILVSDNDIRSLWHYLLTKLDITYKNSEYMHISIPIIKFQQFLYENNLHTSIPLLSQEKPYRRLKKEISNEDISNTTYQINESNDIDNKSVNQTNSSKSSLQSRIQSKIKSFSRSEINRFIDNIRSDIKRSNGILTRQIVTLGLLNLGMRLMRNDGDDIWTELSNYQCTAPNFDALMRYLDIDSSFYNHLYNQSNVIKSNELINEPLNIQLDNKSKANRSDSVFQFINPSSETLKLLNDTTTNHPIDDIDPVIRVPVTHTSQESNYYDDTKRSKSVRRSSTSTRMSSILSNEPLDRTTIDSLKANDTPINQLRYDILKVKSIEVLQINKPIISSIFRQLIGTRGHINDISVSTSDLAKQLLLSSIQLPLTLSECIQLLNDMTDKNNNNDNTFTSVSRIYYNQMINYLDNYNKSIDSIDRSANYKNLLLKDSIVNKLIVNPNIKGDKLKLLSLTPRLKLKHRDIMRRGRNINSWDALPEICSLYDLKSLLLTIELVFDNDEMNYIYEHCSYTDNPNLNDATSFIGERGVKLGNVMLFLSQLL